MAIIAAVAAVFGLMISCGGAGSAANGAQTAAQGSSRAAETPGKKLIAAVMHSPKSTIRQGETVKLSYSLAQGAKPDSTVLFIGGRRTARIDTTGSMYRVPANHPVGRVQYRITAYAEGGEDSRAGEFTVHAAKPPVMYGHKMIRSYPHATDAYTQGLLFHDGFLYESTGLEGSSTLRKVDLASGRVLKSAQLPRNYFGEGLALLGGKLYQLTWHNNKAIVYDLNTFDKIGEYPYGGEGWGLATDGELLYMSDGTERIYVIDPDGFRRIRTIEVYTDQSKVMYVNELEWIDGELWANIYTTETIIRIDPQTGAVTGVIDMGGLLTPDNVTRTTDVMNGIALDKATGRIFVTGKNWNKLFEVEVVRK